MTNEPETVVDGDDQVSLGEHPGVLWVEQRSLPGGDR